MIRMPKVYTVSLDNWSHHRNPIWMLTFISAAIFTSTDLAETVAINWLSQYDADNTAAMADLVNCVLKSAGCDIKVTEDDINDPDNVPSRLNDLQEEYKDVRSTSI
jgi:cohesin complex subunit SA-1/2